MLLADTTATTPTLVAAAASSALAHVKHDGVPGGVVAVERDGRIVITPYGVTDLTTKKPVTEDTQFEIGSVSKQFTAAAILQLAQAGKLSIDDKIGRYLTGVPHGNDVTLRQLLNQTSGIKDFFDRPNAAGVTQHTSTDAQMYAFIAHPLLFTPGSQWQYSNTNYWLLGRILERVSGESYGAYVRAKLFAPAGMTQSAFVADEARLPNFSQGHWRGADGKQPLHVAPAIESFWATGAGSIVSTAGDLLRWDDALRAGKIVSPQSYALMTTPARLNDGSTARYGMGIGLDELDGHRSTWHNGGSNGTHTMNAVYPNDNAAIVVIENSIDSSPEAASRDAFFALFPDALVAENTAAPDEDLTMRARAQNIVDEVLAGNVPSDTLVARFRSIASPQMQRQIADSLKPLGAQQKLIYRGKSERDGMVLYNYHVVFEHGARDFMIGIEKSTSLIGGIGIQ